MFCIDVDLSERKRTEEALRKAHNELELRVEERTAEFAKVNDKLRREIEERKRAEEALRESREWFRAIFETAEDSIFIKDRHLRYTLVNPTMERLFGVPASQLLEKSDEELFGDEAGAHIREVDSCVLRGEIIDEEDTKPLKRWAKRSKLCPKEPWKLFSGITGRETSGSCGMSLNMPLSSAPAIY